MKISLFLLSLVVLINLSSVCFAQQFTKEFLRDFIYSYYKAIEGKRDPLGVLRKQADVKSGGLVKLYKDLYCVKQSASTPSPLTVEEETKTLKSKRENLISRTELAESQGICAIEKARNAMRRANIEACYRYIATVREEMPL